MRLRFGDCIFDSETRELIRAGQPRPLSPRAFHLLQALLEQRPRALSQKELHEWLWPETFVARSSLFRLVSEVRQAIGDDTHQPRYVRTVPRYGYAFFAPAADERGSGTGGRSAPTCFVLWAGREIPLADGETVIGRGPECAIRVDSPKVSRRHARIEVSRGKATLADLGSKNGTFLQGRRLDDAATLFGGDEICVGPAVLIFRTGGAMGTTESG
jgi:DNA-binding winged helix-turn-helix (wHTH) protein